MLVLGFGSAGLNLISQYLRDPNRDLGDMIPGQKIEAIFAFCDIRSFTNTTEVLKEDVMVFVNSIAKLVHNCVHSFSGNANKNVGDAFLLVWKYKQPQSNQIQGN